MKSEENAMHDPRDNVLVVDDAGIVRLACQRALEREGFEVRTAADGQAAIMAMQQRPASVVLLDLKMPNINGLELMRPMAELWPEIEVVIITAYKDNNMIEECRKLGANSILIKPFNDVKIVVRETAKALTRARMRRGLMPESAPLLKFILVETGWIEREDLENALRAAARSGKTPLEELMAARAIDEDSFQRAVTDFLDIPFVHLDPMMVDPLLFDDFPLELARECLCIPISEEDGKLQVVAAEPLNDEVVRKLESRLEKTVETFKGRRREIIEVLEKLGAGEMENPSPNRSPLEQAEKIKALLAGSTVISIKQARLTELGGGKVEFSIAGVVELEEKDLVKAKGDRAKEKTVAASGE